LAPHRHSTDERRAHAGPAKQSEQGKLPGRADRSDHRDDAAFENTRQPDEDHRSHQRMGDLIAFFETDLDDRLREWEQYHCRANADSGQQHTLTADESRCATTFGNGGPKTRDERMACSHLQHPERRARNGRDHGVDGDIVERKHAADDQAIELEEKVQRQAEPGGTHALRPPGSGVERPAALPGNPHGETPAGQRDQQTTAAHHERDEPSRALLKHEHERHAGEQQPVVDLREQHRSPETMPGLQYRACHPRHRGEDHRCSEQICHPLRHLIEMQREQTHDERRHTTARERLLQQLPARVKPVPVDERRKPQAAQCRPHLEQR